MRSRQCIQQCLSVQVHTVGVGVAIGQSCMLLSAGTKGKRFMLPHATGKRLLAQFCSMTWHYPHVFVQCWHTAPEKAELLVRLHAKSVVYVHKSEYRELPKKTSKDERWIVIAPSVPAPLLVMDLPAISMATLASLHIGEVAILILHRSTTTGFGVMDMGCNNCPCSISTQISLVMSRCTYPFALLCSNASAAKSTTNRAAAGC